MKKKLGLFCGFVFAMIAQFISADDVSHPLVYKIDIKKEISNTTRLYLSNGLAEANALGADAVLIHMNTYGGQVDAADHAYGNLIQPDSRLRLYRQQCSLCRSADLHCL